MTHSSENWWIQQKELPCVLTDGDVIMLNNFEFIIVPHRSLLFGSNNSQSWGIYKYNSHSDEWSKFIKYPSNIEMQYHRIAFDKHTQTLYAYGQNATMISIDFNSINSQNCFKSVSNCTSNGKLQSFIFPCLVHTKDSLHLIGGYYNPNHLNWQKDKQSFEIIHTFEKYSEIGSSSVLYVPSKDIILLFGGMDAYSLLNINCILMYSIQSKEWKVIINDFNVYEVRVILTKDEQHAIIVGGHDMNGAVNTIYVLDINENDTYKLRKSSICPPEIGKHHIVGIGGGIEDELLSAGFIKSIYKNIPNGIVKIVQCFYNKETIHWLEWGNDINDKNATRHFVISVCDILNHCD